MIHSAALWVDTHGYGVIFGLFAGGIIGLPLPNDLLLASLGHFIYKGKLLPVPTIFAAFLGSICGMTFNYFLGRTLGTALVTKYGSYIRVTPEKIDRLHAWFKSAGRWGLLIANFLPGVRHLAPLAAGTSRITFLEFAFFTFAGTFAWVGAFISLGYFLEEEWARQSEKIQSIFGIVSAAVFVFFVLYLVWKGRTPES